MACRLERHLGGPLARRPERGLAPLLFLVCAFWKLQRSHVGAEGMHVQIRIGAEVLHLAACIFDERPGFVRSERVLPIEADFQRHDHQTESERGADARHTSASRRRLRAGGRLAKVRESSVPKRHVAFGAHARREAGLRCRSTARIKFWKISAEVSGPTPPGTGVSAAAIPSAEAASTSPASFPST